MRKALIDLASDHAAWSVPAASLDTLREAFGAGWEVCAVPPSTASDRERLNGSIDRGSFYADAEVYFGWGIPRQVLSALLGTLKWVHSAAAGVGASTTIGFCTRGFHQAVAAQRECRWAREVMTASSVALTEFSSLRVGIVGLGGIGMAVARKCAGLGMEVRAVRRVTSAPKPAEVEWVGGPGELQELAAQSDVLVLSLPHTGATDNLVDDSVLLALPLCAYALNVSRGGILDETALLAQMDTGHIGGCVLDVFRREPLDREHRRNVVNLEAGY